MCNQKEHVISPNRFQFVLSGNPQGTRLPGIPDENEICFELWGFLGRHIASEILEMIKPHFAERRKVVLDLSAVHGLDSAGIAILVECLRMGSESHCGFRIVGINPAVKEVLDIVRIHTLFEDMEITQSSLDDSPTPRIINRLNLRGAS